jgi:Na+-transporting NADH:ubiquinone oxidoreductase subunit A
VFVALEVMRFKIRRGLDLPLSGEPEQLIGEGPPVTSVALLGDDHPGLRPSLLVAVGERVRLGQPLFADRRYPEVRFASPGAGVVRSINRGERRALQSVVVELDGDERERFPTHPRDSLPGLARARVSEMLLASGLWTALRTRPYGRVPAPGSTPHSVFVTATDTNPLAPRPEVIIEAQRDDFVDGLSVLSRLTEGPVFLCKSVGSDIPAGDPDRVTVAEFEGPHPAGLAGTHIHLLDPVGPRKTVWHVGYQDVIAIGRLFTRGQLRVERVVALAGSGVQRPRLVRTRLGASTNELLRGELREGESRIISGSVLSGRHALAPVAYLGRFHTQVCAISEGRSRELLPWLLWGLDSCATGLPLKRRRARRDPTPSLHGRPKTMLPLGTFERVVPLDILPTPLLRALLIRDTDMARALGCLELDEEDLALCSFLCPSKIEYGPLLRSVLAQIEKES